MLNRFETRHEAGSDWAVVDSRTGATKATGLSEDEAEETAEALNKEAHEANC